MEFDKHKYKDKLIGIFRAFDFFCRSNNLRYTLVYGSLLGAVRHKGIIPWDDDIDVAMPRPDYEKFLQLTKGQMTKDYGVISHKNTPNYYLYFAKIIDLNTCIVESLEDRFCPIGVFVDVFPINALPNDPEEQKYQQKKFNKNYYNSQYIRFGNISPLHNVKRLILKNVFGIKHFLNKINYYLSKYSYDNAKEVKLCFEYETKKAFDKKIFEEFIELDFEGIKAKCVKRYDECLKYWYNDYLSLPPEKDRRSWHAPYFIDLEKSYSYKELIDRGVLSN